MVSIFSSKLFSGIISINALILVFVLNVAVDAQGESAPVDFYTGNIFRSNPVNSAPGAYANKTVEHHKLRIFETGQIDGARDYSYRGGITKLEALGFGKLQGSKNVQLVEALNWYSVNLAEGFRVFTDPAASEDEYLEAKSGFDVAGRAHSAVVGTKPNPGETGYMDQVVASRLDEDGEYLNYKGKIELSDGRTRMNTAVGGSSADVDVEGHARVKEKAVVDTGGAQTGWWDVEWETDEDE